jgi:hypothetical protein
MRFPVGVIVGSASFRNHNSAPEVTVVSTEAMDWDSRTVRRSPHALLCKASAAGQDREHGSE